MTDYPMCNGCNGTGMIMVCYCRIAENKAQAESNRLLDIENRLSRLEAMLGMDLKKSPEEPGAKLSAETGARPAES